MLNILEARLTEMLTGTLQAQGRIVPAFIHSDIGQQWASTFPSVSYDLGAPIFDPSRYVSDRDRIAQPASMLEVRTYPDGSTRQGTRLVNVRKHPNPYKVPVTLNLWATTSTDINDLSDNLLRLLDPRGTIHFIDDLGNPRSWWMFFDNMRDLSDLDERIDGERKFRIVFTYSILAWLEVAAAQVKERPTISHEPKVIIGIKDP